MLSLTSTHCIAICVILQAKQVLLTAFYANLQIKEYLKRGTKNLLTTALFFLNMSHRNFTIFLWNDTPICKTFNTTNFSGSNRGNFNF